MMAIELEMDERLIVIVRRAADWDQGVAAVARGADATRYVVIPAKESTGIMGNCWVRFRTSSNK